MDMKFVVRAAGGVFAGSALLAASATAQIFESATLVENFSGGNGTYRATEMCVGDINADGYDDVLIRPTDANPTPGPRIWWGGAAGMTGPTPVSGLPLSPGAFPMCAPMNGRYSSTELTRMNGDAHLDLVFSDGTTLNVWAGDGAGGFAPSQSLPGFGGQLLALDLDHDGDTDVVSTSNATLWVLRNDSGTLQLAATNQAGPAGVGRAFAGKFSDGPGPDLLFRDRVFVNDGLGSFTSISRPELASTMPGVFGTIDLNGDGLDDLLVNGSFAPLPTNPILLWWVQPGGSCTVQPMLFTAILSGGQFVAQPSLPTPFAGTFAAVAMPAPFAPSSHLAIVQLGPVSTTTTAPSFFALASAANGSLAFDGVASTGGMGIACAAVGNFVGDQCPEVLSYNLGVRAFFISDQTAVGDFGTGVTLVGVPCGPSPSPADARTAGRTILNAQSDYISRIVGVDFDADGLADLAVTRASASYQGVNTGAPASRTLYFRNLGGRFDFERPAFYSGTDQVFSGVEVHDVDGDGRAELCSALTSSGVTNGVYPLRTRPIAGTAAAALPQFWDQSLALGRDAAPLFAWPSNTSAFNYSSTQGPTSASSPRGGPSGMRMFFDATGDGVRDFVWFQNFGVVTNTTSPSRITVQSPGGAQVETTTGVRLCAVAPFDFDADGDLDLIGVERASVQAIQGCSCFSWTSAVALCYCPPQLPLVVLLNNGAGVFSPVATTIPVPRYSDDVWPEVRVADVTGDGVRDVVILSYAAAEAAVYPGTPTGMSPTPIVSSTGVGFGFSAIADIDRDGDADLVASLDYSVTTSGTMSVPRRLGVFLNDGTGRFVVADGAAPLSSFAEYSPVLADFDRDGDADLAYAHSNGVISISMNLTPPACGADFDADGSVGTPDLVFFLGRFGASPTPGTPAARADFDASGVVDTADLVFFIGRFGEACH